MNEKFLKNLENATDRLKKDFIALLSTDILDDIETIEIYTEIGFEEFNGFRPIKFNLLLNKIPKEDDYGN